MSNSKLVGLAGLGIGIVFASGCITRGSGSFSEVGPAEPDLSAPYGENPMPAAVASRSSLICAIVMAIAVPFLPYMVQNV